MLSNKQIAALFLSFNVGSFSTMIVHANLFDNAWWWLASVAVVNVLCVTVIGIKLLKREE